MRSRNSEPSSPDGAWQYALKLLAARDYTVAVLREKLRVKGFADEDAEAAIARLLEGQWIDDRRFAQRFAEAATASGRCYGPRLRLEMRRRGVPDSLIGEVLSAVAKEREEGDDVRAVLERRFPGFSFPVAGDREKRRVIGFLQRRGFGMSAIMRVMRGLEQG